MNSCYSCKYYDSSVDCCNADDLCYTQGYEQGYADAIDAYNKALHEALNNAKHGIIGHKTFDDAAERLKEQK